MSWFSNFLTSSLGRKLVMSLSGLFLISFLIIHLIGNLQLLLNDGGEAFNIYAKFMTTNPLIQTVSYLLYTSILLHAIQGWLIWRKNRQARGTNYAVKLTRGIKTNVFAARNMGWLGTIVFVFLVLHLYQFWLQMKLGSLPTVNYDGVEIKDLYTIVSEVYSNIAYVLFYVISMIIIALHLDHGFQSAFQTLGWNHRKYTPVIKTVGRLYAVLVPLGFAIIPLYMYFVK